MSKKVLFLFISAVILIVIFIFMGSRHKKHVVIEVPPKKLSAKNSFVPKAESFKKKSRKVKENKRESMAKPLSEISIDEIRNQKNTAATSKKEEFDLTPSPEDLIRMKKNKIRTY